MGRAIAIVSTILITTTPALAGAQHWSVTWYAEDDWEVDPTGDPDTDGDVCAEGVLVVAFAPGADPLGATHAEDFFRTDLGVDAVAERIYDDWMIHPDHRDQDPNGLRRHHLLSGVDLEPTLALDELRWELLSEDLIQEPADVYLDCQVISLAGAVPEAYDRGWNLSFLRADPAIQAHLAPRIAILDTGIDAGHRAFTTPPDLGAAWDYVHDDADVADRHGHGTHVAGIVAAVAPGADILPVQVLDDDGLGRFTAVGRGVLHAAASGADVVNMSLGSPRPAPAHLQAALDEAAFAWDVVLVGAGGHGCAPGSGCSDVFVPAREPQVLSVGAVDRQGVSEDRAAGGLLDLLAPGVGVCSAWPQADTDPAAEPFRRWSGSSMAAAHAAAVAGLVRAGNPMMSADDVRQHLVDTALWETTAFTCPGEAGLLDACNALGLADCPDRWDFVEHPRDLSCSAAPGIPLTAELVTTAATPGAPMACPGLTLVADSHPPMDPAMASSPAYYCPDQHDVLSLRCASGVSGLPVKSPCTDCDLEILSSMRLRLHLRLAAPDLGQYDDLLLRLTTGSGQVYVYSLGVGSLGGTKATLGYILDLSVAGGPDLTQPGLSAALVSQYSGGGRPGWVADPLHIQ